MHRRGHSALWPDVFPEYYRFPGYAASLHAMMHRRDHSALWPDVFPEYYGVSRSTSRELPSLSSPVRPLLLTGHLFDAHHRWTRSRQRREARLVQWLQW